MDIRECSLQLQTPLQKMKNKSNIQLISNVYPVKVDGEHIDFRESRHFVARVWDREALIKLFRYVCHIPPDTRLLKNYANGIHGISQWQIKRIMNSDECSLCPGEKPWGIVIRGDNFEEVCRCERHECSEFKRCRPNMGTEDGVKKRD